MPGDRSLTVAARWAEILVTGSFPNSCSKDKILEVGSPARPAAATQPGFGGPLPEQPGAAGVGARRATPQWSTHRGLAGPNQPNGRLDHQSGWGILFKKQGSNGWSYRAPDPTDHRG